MPIATLNGKSGHITDDQVSEALSLGYTVTADNASTSSTTGTGGVAIDPTVSQNQWLLNYLLQGKDRETNAASVQGGLANTQYGNETSRAGVVGNLYASLFGTPANWGAVSNLMRGRPDASGLSFWNALAGRSHPGEGTTDPRGRLHNIDPDKVIADLFGGVASGGQSKGGHGSTGDGGSSGSSNGAYSSGSGTQASGSGQGSTVQGHVRQSYGSYDGLAGGGGMVIEHPATIHLADGRVIPIGEYGRPERLTVTPLATNPLPPRYYAGLMPGSQQNGMAPGGTLDMPMAPDMGSPDMGMGAVPAGIDPTNPSPDPQTLAEITAVLHTPPALHPSATEQAIRANWTLDARGHPQFTGAQQQQQAPPVMGAAPDMAAMPGMAAGGTLTFGGGNPAVLYPGAAVTTSASAPTDTGQVTSAGTHAGHPSTGPYYNRSPWADPRYAQTRDIMNLSPLEKGLLESTTAAMGLPASEWWALYERSRPTFQQASMGAAWSRAA